TPPTHAPPPPPANTTPRGAGEKPRHSRLFVRMLEQLQPQAPDPIDPRIIRLLQRIVLPQVIHRPALFCVLVLAGEEIPDLVQKLASEHLDTDTFIREVNRYHRQEEARHLNFAHMVLPELWGRASRVEKLLVHHFAPLLVGMMFDMLVHPGAYEVVGLPGWPTWRQANRTPNRRALKHRALRPVAKAMLDAGALVS